MPAPDPAQLAPDDLDFTAVWHHPALLLAEICYGVLDYKAFPGRERVGQLDYDGIDGCSGASYSSALICRPENAARLGDALACSFAGLTMAFNSEDSLSGVMALRDDVAQQGGALAVEARLFATGGHRQSVRAVITGIADFASVDARSWSLAREFEPGAARLTVSGFTRKRPGIALIAPGDCASIIRGTLKRLRAHRGQGPFGAPK